MLAVTPIGKSTIDWPSFIKNAQEALGRSVTKSLDSFKIVPDNAAAFTAALGELRSPNTSPIAMLKDPGASLQHSFYSFLVAAGKSAFYNIMQETPLFVWTGNTSVKGILLGVISGNLEAWRLAIINGGAKVSSNTSREFVGQVVPYFEKEGFRDLWTGFKKSKADGIFLLEKL